MKKNNITDHTMEEVRALLLISIISLLGSLYNKYLNKFLSYNFTR